MDGAPKSTRGARGWIALFLAVLVVFGLGQLESWPFTSWYMFSRVEPEIDRIARAVAVAPDGSERVLSRLPAGLVAHRLRQRMDAGDAGRAQVCRSLLAIGRSEGAVLEVRVEELSWDPLIRAGDRPAEVETLVLEVCR